MSRNMYFQSLKNVIFSKLVHLDIIKFGNFTLKNGMSTDIYMDLRLLINYPQVMSYLSKLMDLLYPDILADSNIKLIPVPLGGLPWGIHLAYERQLPYLLLRDNVKDHGTKKLIEGVIQTEDTKNIHECSSVEEYILIEDVITSGTSLKETILRLSSISNFKYKAILSICNRGSLDNINEIPIYSLFTLDEIRNYILSSCPNPNTYERPLLNYFKYTTVFANSLYMLALEKKSNLIISCDFMSNRAVIELVNKLGYNIIAVKLHLDILDNLSYTLFITELKELKTKYNFLIIEDAKYADIEAIMIEKINHSQLDIKTIADAVTVHAISGFSILEGCKLCIPVITVAEMSNIDNIITDTYSQTIISQVRLKLDNTTNHMFGGLVCQTKVPRLIEPFEMLTMSPGINLEVNNDSANQIYTIPDNRKNKMGLFWIIGRGITQYHKNEEKLMKTVKDYQRLGWDYFLRY
jgi:uridine monophosphate synthetase